MIVVAGPPGAGKSTAFPVAEFGVDYFNADDRAAALNNGVYHAIPPYVRSAVNGEFEQFILSHIADGVSFAFETTLRTDITLKQALHAKRQGFTVLMKYVAMGAFEDHLERVAARAQGGGHSASGRLLRSIYNASLRNLPAALTLLDEVDVYDNAQFAAAPVRVLSCAHGQVLWSAPPSLIPPWLHTTLTGTPLALPQF